MYNRNLEQPLNANERYLHAIAVRLDRIISLLEHGKVESEPIQAKKEELVDQPPKELVEEDNSNQCQGVTAKGTQCKRDAQEGSIYCSTHEPKE